MAFGLALSFYRNVLFEETLENIGVQNDELSEKITQGYRNLEYFKSVQYKDKYAKENLNLLSPGEKVLIITEEKKKILNDNEEETLSDQQRAMYYELLRQMPIIEHWRLYLFHKEKIEALQKAI